MEVLERCAERVGYMDCVQVQKDGDIFYVGAFSDSKFGMVGEAPTLPLAICRFAVKLFAKN